MWLLVLIQAHGTNQLRPKGGRRCVITVFLLPISLCVEIVAFAVSGSARSHCYVKLTPPTPRTSPHITACCFPASLLLLLLSALFFFDARMHIFLSLLFLCGSHVCLKGGSFGEKKWSVVVCQDRGSFIKVLCLAIV